LAQRKAIERKDETRLFLQDNSQDNRSAAGYKSETSSSIDGIIKLQMKETVKDWL